MHTYIHIYTHTHTHIPDGDERHIAQVNLLVLGSCLQASIPCVFVCVNESDKVCPSVNP